MNMKKVLAGILSASLVLTLAACSGGGSGTTSASGGEASAEAGTGEAAPAASKSDDNTVVVYSAYTLEFLDPLIEEFEKETGVKVDLIAAGTGELLKRIESETNNPLGDILFAGTVSTVTPQMELFEDYVSPNEEFVLSDEFKNSEKCITRATLMPSVLMVNTNLIGDIEINGYEDLLNPALKGKIAAANPAQTASGWEHLVNMLYAMGGGDTDEAWDYVTKFCENLDGKLLNSSSAVYKGVADGEYTVGLTYETGGADYVVAGAPVKLVYMEEGVIFRGTNVCIVKNAPHMENAQKFVDFLTGKEAQTMMVTELNNRGIRNDLPDSPILKPYGEVNALQAEESVAIENKKNWCDKFTDIYTSVS
ncbi:ABC transporter substrate-binding protein [Harryflintia acetispora]|uniref:Iron(III) transport system substrate-binding protein n=1 Tax=Harryflintia acetispora TaxID=1849041 RepID=A0A9X8UJF4_9FIRM|nr:ABC transporter substrate-binding protein [Harryflintia acetispora]TCL43477.1 iron(III) transport system substrate-binding protein [Harryflintia acetispora]